MNWYVHTPGYRVRWALGKVRQDNHRPGTIRAWLAEIGILPKVKGWSYGRVVAEIVVVGGPAVDALTDALDDPHGDVRMCAAEALGIIGPEAARAVPEMLRMADVEIALAQTRWECGKNGELMSLEKGHEAYGMPGVPEKWHTYDPCVQTEILLTGVTRIGMDLDEVAPRLVRLLDLVDDPAERDLFGWHPLYDDLGKLGPDAAGVAGDLARKLREEGANVEAIYCTLGRIGHASPEVMAGVRWALTQASSSSPSILDVRVLKQLSPQARPHLIEWMHDGTGVVQMAAMWALSESGDPPEGMVATLTKIIEDHLDGVDHVSSAGEQYCPMCSDSVLLLDEIGPSASLAVPALLAAYEANILHPQLVRGAMARIGPAASAAEPLFRSVFDGDPEQPGWANAGVGLIMIDCDEGVMSTLLTTLRNGNRDVRDSIAVALKGRCPSDNAALDALVAIMEDGDSHARVSVAWALLGSDRHNAAVTTLVAMLEPDGNDRDSKVAACHAFITLTTAAEDGELSETDLARLLPVFLRSLDQEIASPDEYGLWNCVESVGMYRPSLSDGLRLFGRAGRPALPLLRRLLLAEQTPLTGIDDLDISDFDMIRDDLLPLSDWTVDAIVAIQTDRPAKGEE